MLPSGLTLSHVMHGEACQMRPPKYVVGHNKEYRCCEQHWNNVLLLFVLLMVLTVAL